MDTKQIKAPLTLLGEDQPGTVEARISSFNVIDKDGDVVLPGAFPDAAAVPLCSWGHKWDELPVGRGTITQDTEAAYFRGQFFLDTTPGRDTYLTVKQLGDLQEYSYGFQIADAFPGEQDGQPVRFIRKFARVFEASPVLVGAGEGTGTLTIKAATTPSATVTISSEPTPEPDEALLAELKAGQPQISTARRARLAALRDELDALLAETAPKADEEAPPAEDAGKATRRAVATFLRLQAEELVA